jgi:hypothetical protein
LNIDFHFIASCNPCQSYIFNLAGTKYKVNFLIETQNETNSPSALRTLTQLS